MNSSQEKAPSPLFIAAANRHGGIVQELIARHHDMNGPDRNSATPLMQACRNGHIDVAKFLINHDADVSARNISGYTALYMAAEIGNLELVSYCCAMVPLSMNEIQLPHPRELPELQVFGGC
ncbi:hypothetical protein N7481_002123 [Penicillium waksmanii]|uniref:uncharacterized protein n=1 Tax=Penicillium waksmanii TaxID=69791 RepID=UPI002549AC10|nr:uncharacterized protein N7481_002123 [Penicillium waksmanii]KAJ5995146.1 hypothetical protein N7481_002123 [Penicillium waksmanii]